MHAKVSEKTFSEQPFCVEIKTLDSRIQRHEGREGTR